MALARIMRSRLAWGGAAMALRLGGSFLTLPLALAHLRAEEMGVWYLYLGIGALASRLDFGLGPTASRGFSYVLSGSLGLNAGAARQGVDLLRVASFVTTTRRCHQALAMLVVVLLAVSLCTLPRSADPAAGIPWLWSSAITYGSGLVLGVLAGAELSLATGADVVVKVQRAQILAACANTGVAICGLWAGYGLLAMATGLLVGNLLLQVMGRRLVRAVLLPLSVRDGSWSQPILIEMWPQMWRTGLMSLGAYVIYYANTFQVAAHLGLAQTASWGLSYQVAMLIVTIGCMPLMLAQPVLARSWAEGDPSAAWRRFSRDHAIGIFLAVLAAGGAVILGQPILTRLGSHTPLLPMPQMCVLMLIVLLEANHVCYALFVTSRGEVPFLIPALASAAGVLVGGALLVPLWGVWGGLLALGVLQASCNNWLPIWYAYRRVPGRKVVP